MDDLKFANTSGVAHVGNVVWISDGFDTHHGKILAITDTYVEIGPCDYYCSIDVKMAIRRDEITEIGLMS